MSNASRSCQFAVAQTLVTLSTIMSSTDTLLERVQEVVDLVAWVFAVIVHAGKVRQHVKITFFLQVLADGRDLLARHGNGELAAKLDGRGNPVAVLRFQSIDGGLRCHRIISPSTSARTPRAQ